MQGPRQLKATSHLLNTASQKRGRGNGKIDVGCLGSTATPPRAATTAGKRHQHCVVHCCSLASRRAPVNGTAPALPAAALCTEWKLVSAASLHEGCGMVCAVARAPTRALEPPHTSKALNAQAKPQLRAQKRRSCLCSDKGAQRACSCLPAAKTGIR